MKILEGIRARSFIEAVELVRHESGVEDISLETMELFESLVDTDKFDADNKQIIGTAIRERYRSKPYWRSEWWYVPLPRLSYDARDTPQIDFEIAIYLVAKVKVETGRNYDNLTLLETLGRPQTLVLPLLLLQSLLDEELDTIRVVGRSPGHTIFEIQGIKPIPLPDEFLRQVEETLKRKPVVDWIQSFGAQGKRIAPLVAGAMLGMLFANRPQQVVLMGKRGCSQDQLITFLESMAYTTKESREMVNQALPYLNPEMGRKEAIKIALRVAGKGG
jgi:hypothetical protein